MQNEENPKLRYVQQKTERRFRAHRCTGSSLSLPRSNRDATLVLGMTCLSLLQLVQFLRTFPKAGKWADMAQAVQAHSSPSHPMPFVETSRAVERLEG